MVLAVIDQPMLYLLPKPTSTQLYEVVDICLVLQSQSPCFSRLVFEGD